MVISSRSEPRVRAGLFAVLLGACGAFATPAQAGSLDLFGIPTDYKLTLGYALAMRVEDQHPSLTSGPVDQMTIDFTPLGSIPGPQCPSPPCIGKFQHTGLPIQANFDDGNRDFKRGSLINNRASAFGQVQFRLDHLGFGNVGLIASGAAHYDQVFLQNNDHDNPDSVNRINVNSSGQRVGPVNTWMQEAEDTNGIRSRLLEAFVYGEWYLTDTMGLALRAGKHLNAWGESLFFPGIVSAQNPNDATKAFVPGVEVKEILLPVNQVSMQLGLTPALSLLAYKQFEFDETEIFPQGDYFSPADLIGPGGKFGYGSINPVHPERCDEPTVTDATTGQPAPPNSMCLAAAAFTNQPEYIYTLRTPDSMPPTDNQWGVGLKYQLLPNFNLGAYHLRYNNHNPNIQLNMGYAYVGDAGGQPVTTEAFNVRVPVSYTVDYADNVEMNALSFSTVFWVFNIGGEIIQRKNIDTSLESTIAGVVAPWGTRGETTQFQLSFLYVNNPDFLMYDEVVVVGEMGYLQVDSTEPVANQDGVCMSGTKDCNDYTQKGNVLFYDDVSYAIQTLILPKGRNVFPGWDIGTPIQFSWLAEGTPSTPGVFGPLFGEGDMRASIGITAQYVQNLEFALNYNAFFGDPDKNIRNSLIRANPYTDKDYASFNVKYNL